jgi:Zn finger protein HypA/HybF involved in hydrogenase expression
MSQAPVICERCEKVFMGGANAFICPACRKKAVSESAKKRNLNRIGIEARRKKGGGSDGKVY